MFSRRNFLTTAAGALVTASAVSRAAAQNIPEAPLAEARCVEPRCPVP